MDAKGDLQNNKVEILIVEDSATQAEQLRYILEQKGFYVFTAANGREALDLLKRHIPNVVISDILMPEMNGYELCKIMRANMDLKNIPVILVTSLSDPKDVIKGLECGANNFIVKPYDEKYLTSRIQYLIANIALREDTKAEMGINVFFAGENYFITAERLQILDLLLSTYENAYHQNSELQKTRNDLREMNEQLERKVQERTSALTEEIAVRRKAEEEIFRINRTLKTLSECNQALVRATDEALLVDDVCRIIKEFGGYRLVLAGYAEKDETKNVKAVAQAGYEEAFLETVKLTWADTEAGYGPIGSAIRDRNIAIFNNVASDGQYPAKWREAALKRGYISAIGLPLRVNSDILGAIAIYSSEKEAFDDQEVKLLSELAADLSFGISSLRVRVDHKLAAEKLKRSELRYRRLFESARDGILIVDAENGDIHDVNQFMVDLLGYPREEYLGKKLWDIRPFKDIQPCKTAFSKLQVNEYISYEDLPLRVIDGRVIPVEFVSNVYKVNGNKLAQCNIRDITQRRQAEHELKKHRDHLEELIKERTLELEVKKKEAEDAKLQAMEANRTKSDFLANMSHELRTPMNSILGFSEILKDGLCGDLNEKQNEYVGDIYNSGGHLLSLINDILDLSKVESGKMELELSVFPLRDVLNVSISMLKGKAMKHAINISSEIAPEADIEIEADERKLKQIMYNLLSNAIKFTPEGGSVYVHARRVGPNTEPRPPRTDGDFLEISVTDTGIGIKPEDIPKLFKEFIQLESVYTRTYEGTGLGLALTKKLVELHGGTIYVESVFGKGSKFVFSIPLKGVIIKNEKGRG